MLSKWGHNKQFKREQKECARPGCKNTLVNSKGKQYCRDPKCVAIREIQEYEKKKKKARKQYHESVEKSSKLNVRIPKNTKLAGKSVLIRCGAKGIKGRCKRKFTIQYKLNQRIYPRYCEEHRNEWRRKLWEEKGI